MRYDVILETTAVLEALKLGIARKFQYLATGDGRLRQNSLLFRKMVD